ncbi:MAG: thioredoxin family protein [Deltaproteobacteria bacterium]|nr:thioredoxin family protein [Deltaproteobacteria bacterium]
MTRALLVLIAACGSPEAGPAQPTPPEPAKSVQLNVPGAMIEVDAALVPGYVTVVDFWGEHCGACVIVGGMLAVQVAHEPRVLIRKVDVGDGFTPVAKAYDIGALPHFRVFDKHKKLRYVLVGNDTLKAPELAKQLAAEP